MDSRSEQLLFRSLTKKYPHYGKMKLDRVMSSLNVNKPNRSSSNLNEKSIPIENQSKSKIDVEMEKLNEEEIVRERLKKVNLGTRGRRNFSVDDRNSHDNIEMPEFSIRDMSEGTFSREKDIVFVNKLKYWEIENSVGLKKASDKVNKERLSFSIAVNDLNSRANISSGGGLNTKFFTNNSHLGDFFRKNDLEQATILLQNITVSKKNFNFSVFKPKKWFHKKEVSLDEEDIEEEKRARKRDQEEKNHIDLNDPIFSYYNIKVDSKNKLLGDTDYYREIIKEKLMIENSYRSELMKMSKATCEKKIEKQKLQRENTRLSSELAQTRESYMLKKSICEQQIAKYEKKYAVFLSQFKDAAIAEKEASKKEILKVTATSPLLTNLSKTQKEKEKVISTPKITTEEFLQFKSDIGIKIQLKKRDLKEIIEKYESFRNSTLEKIERNKRIVEHLDSDWVYMKNLFYKVLKDQKTYFVEMLKKGIDTRNEGLSWIVKRLLELGIPIEHSMFPRFLDNSQIEYIIKLANKQLEKNQLCIILNVIKNRQIEREREKANDNGELGKTRSTFASRRFSNQNDQGNIGSIKIYSQRVSMVFESIFTKYEKLTKVSHDRESEDWMIKATINEFKEKLISFKNNEKVLDVDYDTNELSRYFLENQNAKDFFNEVMSIREHIKNVTDEIESLRTDQIQLFKKKFEASKKSDSNLMKSRIQNDLIYAALFGNSTSL